MTVPGYITLALAAAGALLTAVRAWMAVGSRTKKRSQGCKTGASKTIGTREVQEDEYKIVESQEGVMAVLADGMGKHYGGKIASRCAVQTFCDIFEDNNAFYNPQYYFRKAFQGANREILKQLDESQGRASVAAALIKDRKLYYASVGNVKIAVMRSHELVPVTSGHTVSMLARLKYAQGKLTRQEALSLLEHHRLYNYVGQDGFQDIEFFDTPITLYGGEYVLLMSDGLYEGVKWKELEDCLEAEGSCQDKAFAMIERVNQSKAEDKDNAAVVVLQIR